MTNNFKHKCPFCGEYHTCNLWGEKHLIFCPSAQREYIIETGRQGRQILARAISPDPALDPVRQAEEVK